MTLWQKNTPASLCWIFDTPGQPEIQGEKGKPAQRDADQKGIADTPEKPFQDPVFIFCPHILPRKCDGGLMLGIGNAVDQSACGKGNGRTCNEYEILNTPLSFAEIPFFLC